MDDDTGDIRAGTPRVPRARRNRKQEQEHIREVLKALGGSPEEFDRAHDPADGAVSLGSRVAAYSRLQTTVARPSPPAPPPETQPAPQLPAAQPATTEPSPTPVPRAVRTERERPRRQPRRSAVARLRPVVVALAHAIVTFARALRGPLVTLLHATTQALRLLGRLAVRAAHQLRLYALRAASVVRYATLQAAHQLRRYTLRAAAVGRRSLVRAAQAVGTFGRHGIRVPSRTISRLGRARPSLKVAVPRARQDRRSDDSPEPVRVAAAVLNWVQAPSHASVKPEPPVIPEPEVRIVAAPTVTARPPQPRPARTHRKLPVGLALSAAAGIAVVVAGALLLTNRGGGGGDDGATRSASSANPLPVPTRSEFSDPRGYAAAMTRMALSSGRTEIDGEVACAQDSTFNQWTCQARGKPSLGAYAGRWLTYRCSPTSTPQPGGAAPAVMINCKPLSQSA